MRIAALCLFLLAACDGSGEGSRFAGQGGIGGADLMSHQHAPEIQPDGSIVFWDNGNTRAPQASFLRHIEFDETTVTERFSWTDDPAIFNRAIGDADRLPNGNYLVTAGTDGRIIEINGLGEIWRTERREMSVGVDEARHDGGAPKIDHARRALGLGGYAVPADQQKSHAFAILSLWRNRCGTCGLAPCFSLRAAGATTRGRRLMSISRSPSS